MPSSESAQILLALATLFAAFGALVTSIVSAVISLRNSRGIEEVRHATNSMKDELVAATAKSARQEGVKEESDRRDGME
jgi:predicted anti-sigma-YlaC factor YlaD